MQYNVHEAKTHLSRILEQARQGQEIIIAKAGVPYVRLVPIEQPTKRQLGLLEGQFSVGEEIFDSLDEQSLEDWGA